MPVPGWNGGAICEAAACVLSAISRSTIGTQPPARWRLPPMSAYDVVSPSRARKTSAKSPQNPFAVSRARADAFFRPAHVAA
jgi:hypothetical protein